MFSFPDLSKMQALFEEGLQSFAQVQADVKEIKSQQAEILELLRGQPLHVEVDDE